MKKIPLSGQFTYSIISEPIPEIIDLMSRTVHGTPGKLQYQLGEVGRKMKVIKNCYYLTLWRGDRLLGMIGIVKRPSSFNDINYNSWYLRYFTIFAPLRSETHQIKQGTRWQSSTLSGMLKSLAVSIVENPDKLLEGNERKENSFVFGYIEKDNERSQQFSELGQFGTIRELCTILFSRFRPRQDPCVSRIADEDKPFVIEQLNEFYRYHTMFSTENIFFKDNYYVYWKEGEIVAGLQANPETWSIKAMTGISGRLLLDVFPRLPGLSKIINPDSFKFNAMEGIFYKEGMKDCLIPLIESACRMNGVHFGITWLDTGSPLLKTLDSINKYGIINRFFRRIPGDIKIKFLQMDEKDIRIFRENPAYISCFDTT